MKTIEITCIMEKQIENRQQHPKLGIRKDCSDFFKDFAKEVAKLAEEHGLSHCMYWNFLEEKSHFQQ